MSSGRKEIWELAKQIFVQIQTKEFGRPMKSSDLVKYSLQLAEEFDTIRSVDLEKHKEIKE